MKFRRAGLVSLVVALMAMSGAYVAPTRGVPGRSVAQIVWQARDQQTAPVARKLARPNAVLRTVTIAREFDSGVPQTPVRHPLYQRPPPAPRG